VLGGGGRGEARGRGKEREKENRREEREGGIRKSRERYHAHFLDLLCYLNFLFHLLLLLYFCPLLPSHHTTLYLLLDRCCDSYHDAFSSFLLITAMELT
jgi:hypothetical protein